MIIIYTNRRSKDNLSTVLNYINNNSSRELTYDTSSTCINRSVDVSIITGGGFKKDDVEVVSKSAGNDTVCMCVLPDSITQYRSGEYMTISEFEEYIKEME